MATTTYQTQLEAVQAAIAAVLASPNASVTILGRTYTRHSLADLDRVEQRLRTMATREARGGRRVQRAIPI